MTVSASPRWSILNIDIQIFFIYRLLKLISQIGALSLFGSYFLRETLLFILMYLCPCYLYLCDSNIIQVSDHLRAAQLLTFTFISVCSLHCLSSFFLFSKLTVKVELAEQLRTQQTVIKKKQSLYQNASVIIFTVFSFLKTGFTKHKMMHSCSLTV